jgi:hypothetical protein
VLKREGRGELAVYSSGEANSEDFQRKSDRESYKRLTLLSQAFEKERKSIFDVGGQVKWASVFEGMLIDMLAQGGLHSSGFPWFLCLLGSIRPQVGSSTGLI